MSTLEEQFKAASEHFAPIHAQFPDSAKLKMYGLYNQAVSGDVSGGAPSRTNLVKYAKYSAWKKCQGMPRDLAMKRYISELRTLDPSFTLPEVEDDKAKPKNVPAQSPKDKQLQEKFKRATKIVDDVGGLDRLPKTHRSLLYAYYKQATEGVCRDGRPGFFASKERVNNWREWSNLFAMSKAEAMSKYILQLQKAIPDVVLDDPNSPEPELKKSASVNLRESVNLNFKDDLEIVPLMTDNNAELVGKRLSKAVTTDSDVVFFTGATGFVGKHFLDHMLNARYHQLLTIHQNRGDRFGRYLDMLKYGLKPELVGQSGSETTFPGVRGENYVIVCLVRPSSVTKLARQVLDRCGRDAADKVIILACDLDKADLGIDKKIMQQLEKLSLDKMNHDSKAAIGRERARFFHFAARYEISDADANATQTTIDTAKNCVTFCDKLGLKLDYVSSVAVAGDYNGVFLESSFDEGQEFQNAYARSKFEAEKLVRKEMKGAYTIYRPGVVCGHSVTGEAEKIDGPYYFFKILQLFKSYFPESFVLPIMDAETMPIVPVDYVARAIFHIAFNCTSKENEKKVFHLVDTSAESTPESFVEAINIFAKAAKAPSFSAKPVSVITAFMPRKLSTRILDIPLLRNLPHWWAKNVVGIPEEAAEYIFNRTTYDDSDTQLLLGNAGIRCPSLESYAPVLWDYYQRHLDVNNMDKSVALEQTVAGLNILVTGSTDGIGRALVDRLFLANANVFIIGRNPEKVAKAVVEVKALKPDSKSMVKGYSADLSQAESTDEMIDKVIAENKKIDILVNNAGRSIRRSVEYEYKGTGRFHDFERTMALNYFGSLRCILGFLPAMREQKSGQIINISSVGAAANQSRFSAYVASKSALDGACRCIAGEAASDNVHFSTIFMPLVKTKMIESEGNDFQSRYGSMILPLNRAVDLICDAMITRDRTIALPLTRMSLIAQLFFPRTLESVNSILYRLEPEKAPQGQETSAKAAGSKEQLKSIMGILKP